MSYRNCTHSLLLYQRAYFLAKLKHGPHTKWGPWVKGPWALLGHHLVRVELFCSSLLMGSHRVLLFITPGICLKFILSWRPFSPTPVVPMELLCAIETVSRCGGNIREGNGREEKSTGREEVGRRSEGVQARDGSSALSLTHVVPGSSHFTSP